MSSRGRGRGRGGGVNRPPGSGDGHGISQGSNFNRNFRGGQGSQGSFRSNQGQNRGSSFNGVPSAAQTYRASGPVPAPDPEVTRLEDAAFSSDPTEALGSLTLTDDTLIAQRPGYGTAGQKIVLYANYFQLKFEKIVPMYRYSMSVKAPTGQPDPSRKQLARVIELLLEKINVKSIVTDFSTVLISGVSLFLRDNVESKEYLIEYSVRGFDVEENPKVFRVMVKYDTTINAQQLLDHLSSTVTNNPYPPARQNILQAMNITVAHGLEQSSAIMSVRNKSFLIEGGEKQVFKLSDGVQAFRGYFLSVRPATGRILINAQIQHLATYEPGPLLSLMARLRNSYPSTETAETKLRKIEKLIRRTPVKLTHFTPPRVKKVFGFATKNDGQGLEYPPQVARYGATAAEIKFRDENGKYVTVADYWLRKHGKESSTAPVVNTGTSANPVYTLAEVCLIPSGEPYRRKLSPEETADMIKIAVRSPNDNKISIIEQGGSLIQAYSKAKLNEYGVVADTASFITVNGRVLVSPELQYKDRQGQLSRQPLLPQNGGWKPFLKNLTFNHTLPLDAQDWQYVWIKFKNSTSDRKYFQDLVAVKKSVDAMQTSLVFNGINAKKTNKAHTLQIESETNCFDQIDALFKQIAAQQQVPKLLLVVLPYKSTSIYNAVKKAGDISTGLLTICVTSEKFRNAKADYLGNIALKFNQKLGGINQEIGSGHLGFVSEGKTMIVGIDVTHPAPGEDKAPSIASIVACVNNNLGQWPADIRIQTRREEMVQALKEMIISRLRLWQKNNNNALPEEILVYRDGVSEGQYEIVLQQELPQIRAACEELYPATSIKEGVPRISIVVVGKRHHTRFYSADPTSQGGKVNPKNGTVVDRGVTEKLIWDFYMQAHIPLCGTAKPAHYVVLYDEIFMFRAKQKRVDDGRNVGQHAADMVQTLTHNMCYLFGRATRAVSVCPPAYYADIACERARCWLSRLYSEHDSDAGSVVQDATADEVRIHPRLTDTMFYI